MIQNFKQAARSLARRPGFTALVVLITGLCIGGNASVFSAANAILYQDLEYREIDRLVHISLHYLPTDDGNSLSYPEVLDFQERATLFELISPFREPASSLVQVKGITERVGVSVVGTSHFNQLGIQPHLGRLFSAEEEGPAGSAPFMVISYELWSRLFEQDQEIIGKAVPMGTNTYTVLGVLPPDFFDVAEAIGDIDVWVPPAQVGDIMSTSGDLLEDRTARVWHCLGRLKPGISLRQAGEELAAIAAQLETEYPDSNQDYTAELRPLREYIFGSLHQSMRILLLGAALILLVGCANIAGLLLVRMLDRRNELAMHLALGADRFGLIRQVFAESLLLALLGGVLGVAFAFGGVHLLSLWMDLPQITSLEVNGAVLGVILVASVSTGILFGLPPAFGATRMEAKEGLLQRSRNLSSGLEGSKSRTALLIFQVALVTILLLVAGLLLRSFVKLRTIGVDFNTERLLTMRISLSGERFQDRESIMSTKNELLDRLQEIPGVESVLFWGPGVPGVYSSVMAIQPDGAEEGEKVVRASVHITSPGALGNLGVPLLQGRELRPTDTRETQRVTVITRSIAALFWPGEDAIGNLVQQAGRPEATKMEVVGIIPDAKINTRFTEGFDNLVLSHNQVPLVTNTLVIRTSGPPSSVVERVRERIRSISPDTPPYDLSTIEERLREGETSQRLNAAIVGMYAFLALIFAVLGLYGTLAYSVLQRRREIGIRMAFGADRGSIVKMIMGRGLTLVAIGMVIGVAASFAVTRLMGHLLYGISKYDAATFAVVIAVFLLAAAVATYLPARRAVRVEPTEALRAE